MSLKLAGFHVQLSHLLSRRCHEIRHPHLGPEQRRRDELRASYHCLRNAVPAHDIGLVSHPRPTKIALLDRAATRINSLEMSHQQLLAKIREVEEEAARLRQCVHSPSNFLDHDVWNL